VEGVPVVVVTERRYEAGGITGIVATMLVDVLLVTVSGIVLSFTVGTGLPKFFPVMVIWFVTRLAVALLMVTWPDDAACTRAEVPASARASTATMSVILECDLRVESFADGVLMFLSSIIELTAIQFRAEPGTILTRRFE